MSADEALAAVYNAAKVVAAATGPLPHEHDPRILRRVPVPLAALRGLYAALDAANPTAAAVYVPPPEPPAPVWRPGELTPLPRCSGRGCWRLADLPTATCYFHSPTGTPLPLT